MVRFMPNPPKPSAIEQDLRITICDLHPDLERHWPASDLAVTAKTGSILDIDCDAVVSPANSFGFMDGGVDYVYSEFFGWHVQETLQKWIAARPFKELLVGQALLVPTGAAPAYVISAPTMRVPKRIADLADIFLACRAATELAVRTKLSHIAFPGMGTGCGGVPHEYAAKAMLNGIKAGLEQQPFPATWQEAQARHFGIGYVHA